MTKNTSNGQNPDLNWPPRGFGPYRPDDDGQDKMLAIRLPSDFYNTKLTLKDTVETPSQPTLRQRVWHWLKKFWPL